MKPNNIGIFIQARTGSTRLKNKVLKKIHGKPVILLMIERLKKNYGNHIHILTSKKKSDDKLASILKKNKFSCFRGSETDVLDRFFKANKKFKYKHIVRLTGDCPLIDVSIINRTIEKHLKLKKDYSSNNVLPIYPDGLDVEVLSSKTLSKLNRVVKDKFDREHVTLFIKKNLNLFNVFYFKRKTKYSNLRITLDYSQDFYVIKYILNFFSRIKSDYSYRNLIKYLGNDCIFSKNSHLIRDEKIKFYDYKN